MLFFSFVTIILVAAIAFMMEVTTRRSYPLPAKGSAVFITGTSTGIGRDAAQSLADDGFIVYAGVRKLGDIGPWPGINPVVIDVTDPESVQRAAQYVTDKLLQDDNELGAVVNNAGVSLAIPIEFMDLQQLRHVLDVNVVGVVAVTQAFTKLLRRDHGRVINIGSAAGFMTAPCYGAYAASKHALEAITDATRVELSPWNISVSLIEPGAIVSDIRMKRMGQGAAHAHLPEEHRRLYSTYLDSSDETLRIIENEAVLPKITTDAIRHALTSRHPKTRYYVGDIRGAPVWLIRHFATFLPDRLLDLIKIKTSKAWKKS